MSPWNDHRDLKKPKGERANGLAFLKWRNIILKWRASFSRDEACSSRIHRGGQEPSSVLCCLCRRGAVLSCTSFAILCGAVAVFYLVSLHPMPDAGGLAAR